MSNPLPVPIPATKTSGATLLNDWAMALAGGQGHVLGFVRNKRANNVNLLLAIVPHGAAKPASVDSTDDEMYGPFAPGETYVLEKFGSTLVDVYARAEDGSVGAAFVAWGDALKL